MLQPPSFEGLDSVSPGLHYLGLVNIYRRGMFHIQ